MAQFSALVNLATLDGTDGFVLTGTDNDELSGRSVSSAGDINGDGFDDIIIGAPYSYGDGYFHSGQSYVVFGSGAGFPASIDLSLLDGTGGFLVNGVDDNDESGRSVSSAGDFNGDGFDDLLIGAPYAGPSSGGYYATHPGEAYVVFGHGGVFGGSVEVGVLDGVDGFKLAGVGFDDRTGRSVASAGDVNGDGFGDIIIGAYQADPGGVYNAGVSYVVFGTAAAVGPSLDLSTLDGSNGFRIDGTTAQDYAGMAVKSAGDVNGDGFDDVIIGAYGADHAGQYNVGETYVVFGKGVPFAPSVNLSTLDGTNGFRLDGTDNSDLSGRSVSSAGDINGDGFDDIIISGERAEPFGQPPNLNTGENYVVFGRAGGFSPVIGLTSLDGTNGFILAGTNANGSNGYSISAAGDVNGDGFDDIIIGAYSTDGNGNLDAGRSYVYFGKAGGFSALFSLSTLDGSNGFLIDGIDAGDYSGAAVNAAGDVNGDGFDDIIIGAHHADPGGGSNIGESYIVFGVKETVSLLNLVGAGGDQTIQGGSQSDTIKARAGDDTVFGHQGADTLFGNRGNDTLNGGTGADRLYGQNGNDTLNGNRGNDRLRGNDGDDHLFGLRNNDHLEGGAGNDVLDGGTGKDWLFGGTGADTFVFASGYGTDSIHDWEDGIDHIDLGSYGFLDFELQVKANALQVGADLVVTLGADVLTINNLALADFDVGDVFL